MADIYDPSEGVAPPSDDLTDPGQSAPGPKDFPIKKMGQIRMSGWTIYAEGEKLYARSPKGVKTQIVLYDPSGLTEEAKPNKVSDGSDGSKDSKGLTESSSSTGSTSSTSTSMFDNSSTTTVASITEDIVVEQADVEDQFQLESDVSDQVGQTIENTDVSDPSVMANEGVVEISGDNVYDTTPTFTPTSFAKSLQVYTGTKPAGTYTGTYFLNQDERGKPFADAFLGRTLESEEWDDLIAAVASESISNSTKERAWIMGTILNRCRKSGLLVGQIILDVRQFTTIGPNPSTRFRDGPNDAVDASLSLVATRLPGVLKNNYYYSKSKGRVVKNGVIGIQMGAILVFPGARWP